MQPRLLMMRRLLLLVALSAAGCAAEKDEPVGSSEARLAEGWATVNVDALNLRAGPSTNDTILAVMRNGERVRIDGESVNGFAPVAYGDQNGWAWDEYLSPAREVAIGSLADAVQSLANEAGRRSPGTEVAISAMNLTTGEYAGVNDDVRHVSASSAKVLWVAAAMHAGAGLSDIATPIFANSDNYASGSAIDRAGGPDAVNDFLWNVASMDHSILANWSFGARRVASNQGVMGGDNYFTTRDLMTFYSKLDRGDLVGDRTGELRGYMKLAPDDGVGGWLPALLPAAVRPEVMHKGGWLPPPYDERTINDAGIVQVPDGDRYAVAILARHGSDYWGAQARFVERASCVIYRTIAHDASLSCYD